MRASQRGIMKALIEELVSAAPVLTDGAWGTELQARGLEPGSCPDAWNLAHPQRVEEVARAYVEAGSQIILTNTFGANRIALARHGLEGRAPEINRAAVEISRRAANGRARVFASLGPCGKLLFAGEVTEADVSVAFEEQAKALASAGADAIVIETMSDPAEAKLALAAAAATGLPVVACMTFDSGRDHDRTMMGTTPEQAAAELTAAGADVVGANCGQGAEGYVGVCKRLHAAGNLPVWIKPNAGLPEIVDGRAHYRETPQTFAKHVQALVEAGASFIGGCCGTTPDFIRHLATQWRIAR
jgi:5-methyltetrahydrofolate--homocysteine methyltransferase